jgi:LPS-assembly protein
VTVLRIFFLATLLCFAPSLPSWSIEIPYSAINDALTDNPYNDPWECSVIKNEWRCFEKSSLKPDLHSSPWADDQKDQALIYALGWMPTNSDSDGPGSVCEGHYYQPSYVGQETSEPLSKALSKVDYSVLKYELGGTARLTGHVEIRQPGRRLHTDEAIIYPGSGENKIRRIEAHGHIRISQPGILLLGTEGEADLDSHQAKIKDITYLIHVKPKWHEPFAWDENFSGYAHGQASALEQHNKSLFSLANATYTTCPPTSHAWALHAKEIVLNKEEGRGYAKHTVLDVEGVPVFYLPYFSFPINQERQSGFLYGEAGLTSNDGLYLSLPYYFNLAPNYDWTLTPNLYSKRGVLFDNEFRYLTSRSSGELQLSYIPRDNVYGGSREKISFKDKTHVNEHWSIESEYHFVSDQDYLKDFNANTSAASANTIILPRTWKANYQHDDFYFTGEVQAYQIVNEELSLTNRPYRKLPALTAGWSKEKLFESPLQFDIASEMVHFQKSPLNGEVPINAYRSHLDTAISLPLEESYGHVNPEVRLLGSHYELQHAPHNSLDRTLYQLSMDSGLYFERQTQFGYRTYSQTLEPRLFYLNTPYKEQNSFPIFDSGLVGLTYDSLFAKNRFTSIDRIGEAQQIALGLESTVYNEAGSDVMNMKIGQLFYFRDRKVTVCNTADCLMNEDPHATQRSSDIIAHWDTLLTPNIRTTIELNYDPHTNLMDAQTYDFQYHDRLEKYIFNMTYQENRYAPSQLTMEQLLSGEKPPKLSHLVTSASLQLLPEWRFIGKWDLSLNPNRTIDLFSGLEYSSCCWSVSLLVHRYLIISNPNNPAALQGQFTTVPMIQFELKGLGGTNGSKLSRLEHQIPGVSEVKQ